MDISHTSASVEKKISSKSGKKNKQLVKREEIEGTPFTGIKLAEKEGWFATWGKYKITEEMESLEKLKEFIKADSWELRTTVTSIIAEEVFNNLKNKQ